MVFVGLMLGNALAALDTTMVATATPTIVEELHGLRRPLLVGPSRKSFLGGLVGRPAAERGYGTAAAVATAVIKGAHLVRVHDVAAMRDVVRVADALREAA